MKLKYCCVCLKEDYIVQLCRRIAYVGGLWGIVAMDSKNNKGKYCTIKHAALKTGVQSSNIGSKAERQRAEVIKLRCKVLIHIFSADEYLPQPWL